jgi:hypothetical protein
VSTGSDLIMLGIQKSRDNRDQADRRVTDKVVCTLRKLPRFRLDNWNGMVVKADLFVIIWCEIG